MTGESCVPGWAAMRAWGRRQEDCRSDEDWASVRNDGCASAGCSRMKEGTTRWRVRKSPWSTRTHDSARDSVARQIRRMCAIAVGDNHQKTNCSREC